MVVLLDYTLAPLGKNILTAPDIVDAMRASMSDNKDSPVFAAARLLPLVMPYTFGLEFVRTVLTNGRGLFRMLDILPLTLARSCSLRLT